MQTHKPGHLIQRGQNEDGEFAFLVMDDAEAVAS